MKNFLIKRKIWIFIIGAFLAVRTVVFWTFWKASVGKGGWNNFYSQAQAAPSVLARLFHDFCDWHPPLYYTFTSIILFVFKSQWFIYLAQIILAAIVLYLSYKIAKLFFSEKIALSVAFLVGVEPYWAWHNFLLVSENLFTPLLLIGLYYLLVFVKNSRPKNLYFSGFIFGLATLARPNTLILIPALAVLLAIIFAIKKFIKQENILNLSGRQIIIALLMFNAIFFAILLPWMARNKIIYGNFTLANMLSTNIFFYNLPPLISMQKNISYEQAYVGIISEAKKYLREPIDDQGNCKLYSKEEFATRQNYYKTTSKNYILANLTPYAKMHLVKTTPFFFQSGYFEMWSAYSGEYSKPDITALVLKKNLTGVKKFFKEVNAKLIFYLLGIILWGLASLASVVALVYSYFKDREKFLFFFVSLAIIIINALLIAPFVLARYRLPINVLFFIPLVYMIFEVANWKFKHRINTDDIREKN